MQWLPAATLLQRRFRLAATGITNIMHELEP
jgi:hypothetical protein